MSEIVKKVERLLKLPQELCNTCGKCCKLATFKGGLKHEDVLKLKNSTTEDITQVEGAKDFLTIFEPYKTIQEAKAIDSDFIDRVLVQLGKKEGEMDFYYCKFLGENNLCKIHEDRPSLCRMYPIPHERTLYFKDCGFREKGIENWQKIVDIINELEAKNK